LLRKIVEEIKLAPENREVLITYRTPEPVMDFMVAGALSAIIHNALAQWLTRRFISPKRRSHTPKSP